jgi:hypothetical protein
MTGLLKRLWNDVLELLVMFVGWIIIFLTNTPINFLTIFIVTIFNLLDIVITFT